METENPEALRSLLSEKFGVTCRAAVLIDFRSYTNLVNKMSAIDELQPQLQHIDWLIRHSYVTSRGIWIAS